METKKTSEVQKKKVSGSFSALVVRCLKEDKTNARNMGVQQIAQVIGEEADVVRRIEKGELGFTIEHLIKIGKAYGKPISLLLQKEINKKKVRPELKQAHKNLSHLLAACERLRKASEKAAASIPIREVRVARKKPVRAKEPSVHHGA